MNALYTLIAYIKMADSKKKQRSDKRNIFRHKKKFDCLVGKVWYFLC